jgi:hypothetical protein
MDTLDLVQWPAMIVTVVASWYVASMKRGRRKVGGFSWSATFCGSSGESTRAYALIALQACLAVMNVRGEWKNAQ